MIPALKANRPVRTAPTARAPLSLVPHEAVSPERVKRGRPAIEARELTLGEKLDALMAQVAELSKRSARSQELREALRRFKTSGESAVPLNVGQAALILNRSKSFVHNLVWTKVLTRRCGGEFHPDDIRAFLAAQATGKAVK